MTYERFEDVPVWQDAIRLAELVDDLLMKVPIKLIAYAKRDQIDRASLSISNNIAEGFDRGGNKQLRVWAGHLHQSKIKGSKFQ